MDVALGSAPGAAREALGPPGVRVKQYANPFARGEAAAAGAAAQGEWDMYSEEELRKREARAAKFGTTAPSALIRPSDEEVAAAAAAEAAAAAAAERAEALKAAKQRRAERFGIEYDPATDPTVNPGAMGEGGAAGNGMDGGMELDFLEEAKAAPEGAEVRPEAVHLYGTDSMSTRDIFTYFKAHGPSHVEWINDSSCNVVFPNMYAAKRAMYRLRKPDVNNPLVPEFENWINGVAFEKEGAAAVLLRYRLACHEDVKRFNPEHKTRRLWVKGGGVGKGRGKARGRGLSKLDQPLGGGGGGGAGLSKSQRQRQRQRERRAMAASLGAGNANVGIVAGGVVAPTSAAAGVFDGGAEVDNGGAEPSPPAKFNRGGADAMDEDD